MNRKNKMSSHRPETASIRRAVRCALAGVASLAARVLKAEHRLYPMALALVAGGEARLMEGKSVVTAPADAAAVLYSPNP